MKGFPTIGRCAKCGDLEGPWELDGDLWLCEKCAGREENEKIINQSEKVDVGAGTPACDFKHSENARNGHCDSR